MHNPRNAEELQMLLGVQAPGLICLGLLEVTETD